MGSVLLLIAAAALLWAHEEPPKTIKEKAEKAAQQQKIQKAGIKRIVTWEIEVAGGVETGKRTKTMVREFGRDGSLASLEAFREGRVATRADYSYDRGSNLAEQKTFGPEGTLLDRDLFEYDREGRVVSGRTLGGEGAAMESFRYVPTPDNKTITFEKTRGGEKPEYVVEYRYAGDCDLSHPVEILKRDGKGATVLRVQQTYGADGLRSEKTVTDGNGAEVKRFRYEYNGDASLRRVTTSVPTKTGSSSVTYAYKDGICVQERETSDEGELLSVLQHEFDLYEKTPPEPAAATAGRTTHLGGVMRIGEATPSSELCAHPERWFNKQVRIEGIVASVCKQEGCFIEVIPASGPGEGIVVNFADPGLKFPTDCAGRRVAVEGLFYQKIYPASRVGHWQGHSFRAEKAVPPFSLVKRMTAEAADLWDMTGRIPPPAEIAAADPRRVDLRVEEFEAPGFGTGRKVLEPGEATEKHNSGGVREMVFCLEGELTVHFGETERVTLRPGEMSFIPPGMDHQPKNEGTARCVYLFVYSKAEAVPTAEAKHDH